MHEIKKSYSIIHLLEFFQKRYIQKGFNQNYDYASNLLQKVAQSYKNSTIMKRLSKMALLKFISSIYSEKLKNFNHHNSSPLFLIAYEVFLQKYGLKSVSENKYYQVTYLSIKHLF